MKEYEIAKNKVIPYLEKKWPTDLISSYGRVPVQMGTSTKWADLICYIVNENKKQPWILIEVKASKVSFPEAYSQAESYSLILDAPFFGVTDGKEFDFYMTGTSQGKSIKLEIAFPPKADKKYLDSKSYKSKFSEKVNELISIFLEALEDDLPFRKNTIEHDNDTKQLTKKIFNRLESVTGNEIKNVFKQHIMTKRPNLEKIYKEIDQDLPKVKKTLKYIQNIKGDPISYVNRLLDSKDELHIKGGGMLLISQLLAAAHPDKYIVIDDYLPKSMEALGLTEILVKTDTANSYFFMNEICVNLYNEKIRDEVKKYNIGIAAVHNFLWHWYCYYNDSAIRHWMK